MLILLCAVLVQSESARGALERGIQAGKQNDHLRAVECFQQARKADPDAPEPLFYLGVAESKIPGRELRAMAWFGAYLTARPEAPNAAAVLKQIDDLRASQQRTLERLIQLAEDAASTLHDSGRGMYELPACSGLWARAGNFTAAFKAADRIRDDYGKKAYKPGALYAIAEAYAEAGDFEAAKRTADLIQNALTKYFVLIVIVVKRAKSGDIAGARQDFATLSKEPECPAEIIAGMPEQWMSAAVVAIADAQAREGDITSARATLRDGVKTTEAVKNREHRSTLQCTIASSQANHGDMAGALETVDRISQADRVIDALMAIARVQMRAGDLAGAESSLKRAESNVEKADYKSTYVILFPLERKEILAGVPAEAGPKKPGPERLRVSDWTALLDDADPKHPEALNLPQFLDLAGTLNSRPASKDLEKVFSDCRDLASRVTAARVNVDQLLKRRAAESKGPAK